MKTKKAIFEWWCKEGCVTGAKDLFLKKIGLPVEVKENPDHGLSTTIIRIHKHTWKYHLHLVFDSTGICIHISGY